MKDALGNELKVGDLVMLQLNSPWIHGRIAEASDGGLAINQQQVSSARLVVVSTHIISGPPHMAVASLVALREDDKPVEKEASAITPLPN